MGQSNVFIVSVHRSRTLSHMAVLGTGGGANVNSSVLVVRFHSHEGPGWENRGTQVPADEQEGVWAEAL